MHVLALSTLFPNPANPRFGTFVARSLEALTRQSDWQVTVVNPIGIPPIAFGKYRELKELPPVAQEGPLTVHRPRFTLIPKIGARRNAAAIAKAALPLITTIHHAEPIHVIHAEFFFPDGPAAAIIADELGLPLSIKARGSDIIHWGTHDFAREQILAAADQASGLLAVSGALADDMVAIGIERDKITIHYTGLDRDRFRPLGHPQLRTQLAKRLDFALTDNAPLLVCVGNLIATKGQDIALRALAQLPDARLILVGKGELADNLRALAAELGVDDRVHFTGSVDHDVMPLILSAADAMVLPTQREGLANAWVESIACGTPVVTTDVGGVREIVTSDAAGRIVERTPEAFADAVRAILANPPKPEDVAEAAHAFSWEENGRALAAYLAKLSRA